MTCRLVNPRQHVPVEEFFPYVSPYVMGVPDPVSAQALRATLIDLAQRTSLLTWDVEIDLLSDVPDYVIDLEDCYVPMSVRHVRSRGALLPVVRRSSSVLRGYEYIPPRELVLHPAPSQSAAGGLRAQVVVSPDQDSCTFDRIIYDRYAEPVGWGAASRIMLMRGGSWYDPKLAMAMEQKFKAALADIRAAVSRGFDAGPMTMKTRRIL